MMKTLEQVQKEESAAIKARDAAIIRQGISDAALDALKRIFGYDLPLFQIRGAHRDLSAEKMCIAAAITDGEHGVIKTIERIKNTKPTTL